MRRLPVVRIGSTTYFVDRRLRQIRNVYNPHEFIDFKDEFALEDYLRDYKARKVNFKPEKEANPTGKYLWCPKCKEFPDKVIEKYSEYQEFRIWDGECYQLAYTNLDQLKPESCCPGCGTNLVEKED